MRTPWIVLGYAAVTALWIVASDAVAAVTLGDIAQVRWGRQWRRAMIRGDACAA